MDKSELLRKSSKLKMSKQKNLNNIYLWVKLAKEAIEQLPDTKFEFEVPSTRDFQRLKTVQRDDPKSLKERIVTRDIPVSAFVSIVSDIEDYLSKIMKWILLTDIERIKCTIPGVNFTKDISIVDFLTVDRSELIEEIVDQRLVSLFYAKPQKQLEYLDKAVGIKIDEGTWDFWIEIKARRDLWVHNEGVVNQIYIEKTGNKIGYKKGDIATIDNNYFTECISKLKSMVGSIDSGIRKAYKEKKEICRDEK